MDLERIELESVDSTNEWAKRHLLNKHKEGFIAIAKTQTQGKGQYGRKWQSPKDVNLYLTFCIPLPPTTPSYNLSQVTAVAITKLLHQEGLSPSLKWPNDVSINGGKIAGILTEIRGHCGILGLGLNVNMDEESLAEIPQKATSMLIEKGEKLNLESIQEDCISLICSHLERLFHEGFAPFHDFYESHLLFLKETVMYTDHSKQMQATLDGINDNGSLRLILDNGEPKNVFSGSVAPLTPSIH